MKLKTRGLIVGAFMAVVMSGLVTLLWPVNRAHEPAAEPQSVELIAEVAPSLASAETTPMVYPTNQTMTVRGTRSYVVTYIQPIEKSARMAVEAAGAKVVNVLSETELLVEATPEVNDRLAADPMVASTKVRTPSAKIDPTLKALLDAGASEAEVAIVSLDPTDVEDLRKTVVANGGEILRGCLNSDTSFRAKLSAELIGKLAGRGDVHWLERYVRPQIMNDRAVTEKVMNVTPVWNTLGLTGEGQIVTTSDSGISTGTNEVGEVVINHPDLKNQVIGFKPASDECDNGDTNGHGTHTAGSIVGDGTCSTNELIRGTAYGAKLWAWFCAQKGGRNIYLPGKITDLLQPDPENFTAYIHSASWGAAVNGMYNDECRNFDMYTWEHPEYLPVVSAGNEGSELGTIGAPASAKNVLAVGATENLREYSGAKGLTNGDPTQTAIYSSRGPCNSGRIKPDIAAPGTGVLSTRSLGVNYSYGIYDDYYAYDTGTSMACPLTAGAVTLTRQWLVEKMGYDGEEKEDGTKKELPTAALMKAVITGGAKGALTPNNEQGWGRVDLAETLAPTNRAVKLIDRIPFDQGKEFVYLIQTTNEAPIDVQLAWVDYPGESLVNDLDLTVEARIDGIDELWYGNGGDEPDTLNNIESFRLESVEPTTFVITVNCRKVLYDHTEGGAAALYIRGAFDPDFTPEEPKNVRIRETGREFRLLDQAMDEVEDGQTIELMSKASLRKKATVNVDCTICATNKNAELTDIRMKAGTYFDVASGHTLSLTNVCLTGLAQGEKSVVVAPEATLSVGGMADVGTIELNDGKGLNLAGEIYKSIYVQTPSNDAYNVFATYSCDYDTANKFAMYLLNPTDDELGGGAKTDGTIVWDPSASVPDDVTTARMKDENGNLKNFRSLQVLMKYLPDEGDVGIGLVESAKIERKIPIKNRTVTISSEKSYPLELATAKALQFVCEDKGELVLSNVTLKGESTYRGNTAELIRVDGGRLTLLDGATICDHITTDPVKGGAVAIVNNGRVSLENGSLITNCEAAGGNGGGGGVRVEDGTLAINGGAISDCRATKFGQSVYVDGSNATARVTLAGAPTVDDIYVSVKGAEDPIASINIVGAIEEGASIGVQYEGTPTSVHNQFGDDFALVEAGVTPDNDILAASFFNVRNPELGGYYDAAKGSLIWGEGIDPAGEPGLVRLIVGEVTKEYMTLEEAFENANGDCRIEIASNVIIVERPIEVTHKVLVTTASELRDSAIIWRFAGKFTISNGGSLTLEKVSVADYELLFDDEMPMKGEIFYVNGGEMTLGEDAEIYEHVSYASKTASAIYVRGGTFTMLSGSSIDSCYNKYVDSIKGESGCGGAIYAINSTVNLLGGEIWYCSATYGGAVCLANQSKGYVGNDLYVGHNKHELFSELSDIYVTDGSTLALVEPLSKDALIGRAYGAKWKPDFSYIAQIDDWRSWTEGTHTFEAIVESMRHFMHDTDTIVQPVLVTNESARALIVWSDAVKDGCYRAKDGSEYFELARADFTMERPVLKPEPQPEPEPEPEPEPFAIKSIVFAPERNEVTMVLENVTKGCVYSIYGAKTISADFFDRAREPLVKFAWNKDQKEVSVTVEMNDNRFWRAAATPVE